MLSTEGSVLCEPSLDTTCGQRAIAVRTSGGPEAEDRWTVRWAVRRSQRSWGTSLGAILGWVLVLAESVLGPIRPINPWLLAIAFGLAAPPLGQMHRSLTRPDAEPERPEDTGGA